MEEKYDQAVTQYDELMGMVNLKLYTYDTFRIDKAIDFCKAYKELTNINDGEVHSIGNIIDALSSYDVNLIDDNETTRIDVEGLDSYPVYTVNYEKYIFNIFPVIYILPFIK